MKRCTRCVLPETFPGIQFDAEGVCQYCRRQPSETQQVERRARLRAQFEALAEQVRARPGYHCLVAWSGGKDSTYTLWLMEHVYNLRALAFTFDNGFVSTTAFKNMRGVAEHLKADHVIVKPQFEMLQHIFVASLRPGSYPLKALERASGVCNACMAIAKGIGLRLAFEKDIPLLVYGWSPGQIPLASSLMRPTPQMMQAMVDAAKAPLRAVVGEQIDPYFPERRHLEVGCEVPVHVAPLAFMDYDEGVARQVIGALGWETPQDTDSTSTNCLLNSYACLIHQEQMGFHPYAMELAGLVREGYMERREALERLEIAPPLDVTLAVKAKLGLPVV
ncbi:MAG: hypothetical protein JXD18_04475 [Anaerolineae bacterium]|nr:hypothetical protein [Anaerolineae bacterium]